MTSTLQNVLVGVLVAIAAMYAAWLLLPARPRLRIAMWLMGCAVSGKFGVGLVRRVLIHRLQKTIQRAQNVCGNCAASDIHIKR